MEINLEEAFQKRIDDEIKIEPRDWMPEKYRKTLEKHVADRGIEANFKRNLVELRPDAKEAVFENPDTKEQKVIRYDIDGNVIP